jgi:hypothetical protein
MQAFWKQHGRVGVSQHVLGVAALCLNPCPQLFGAEHGLASHTPFTSAAGGLHPRYADSIADLASSYSLTDFNYFAYWFMTESARELRRQMSVGDVNVRITQAAGPYSY